MTKEILINVSEGEECRIALLEDGKLEELYMERTSATSHVGNIYKGRITNVEPSIQAAFVDFGLGRNGFLHISDLLPSYFGRRGEEVQEAVGRKMARRDRPPIQRCLRRGDEIIVQIIKEGIGTKGPTLSTYLSIPGRILVMMPGMGKMGVSKRIEDEEERRRLRQILDSLKPPKDVGFIIRTAGIGKTKTEIQRDLTYLTRLWQNFEKKEQSGPAPLELYTEGDLVTRTVRDVFSSDVERIVIDNKEVAKRIKEVIKLANPRAKNKVEIYDEPVPLFHKYGMEREIEQIYSRHVPLPSGGSLVIDSTEAIVAIDVNSGKFRDHSDAEMTAFKTDMEAADEIPRQLRLRDLGGVIICDFIDLRYERHRRELEERLHHNLRNDRAKTKVLRMSQFGIIEMTRQRMRPSLKRSIYFDCPHCKGAGLIKTPESMSLDVMRRLAIGIHDERVARVELAVCPDVSFYLLNKKRTQLSAMELQAKKRIVIRSDPGLGLDEMRLELFDNREGQVILEELGMALTIQPHTTQLGVRPPRPRQAAGRDRNEDRQRGRRGRPERSPEQRRDPHMEEDRFDLDNAEDAVEEREGQLASGDTARPDISMEELSPPTEPAEMKSAAAPKVDADSAEMDQSDSPSPDGQPARPPSRRRRRGGRGRGRRSGRPPEQSDEAAAADESVDSRRNARQINEPDDAAAAQERLPQRAKPAIPRDDSAPSELPASEPKDEGDETGPPRRRRRRGGRRHRGRGGKTAANGQTPSTEQQPPSAAPAAAKATVSSRVVRTGSTDRHLISDEPIAPQPVRRPRSSSDLDAIPDDFD